MSDAASQLTDTLAIRRLGLQDYEPVWRAMQRLTDRRDASTPDEIWFTQHRPVFTLGVNSAPEHLLAPGDIPVVQIDRGGQVTYHGPGQLVVYTLIDLKRARLGIRDLVSALENSVIALTMNHGIQAAPRRDAPGVYVAGAKLASLGLRIRRGCSYHGLALNIKMDLEPFRRINPCGFADMSVTELSAHGVDPDIEKIQDELLSELLAALGREAS